MKHRYCLLSKRVVGREAKAKVHLYNIYLWELFKNWISRGQETISCLCSCQLFRVRNETGSIWYPSILPFFFFFPEQHIIKETIKFSIGLWVCNNTCQTQTLPKRQGFCTIAVVTRRGERDSHYRCCSWQPAEGNKFRSYLATASE